MRRAVVDQVRSIAGEDADLFTLEVVLGELLAGEMERGHLALAIIVEPGRGAPSVHVYAQGVGDTHASTHGELRAAILRGAHVPLSIETTAQGRHYMLRPPSRAIHGEVVDRVR